jgi:hypothetical protein
MTEIQLVILFRGLGQLHYVHEQQGGKIPHNAYLVAYTLAKDDEGTFIVRSFFLFHDWHSGVELPPDCKAPMVRADSIAINRPSTAFDPRLAVIVPRRPVRLQARWDEYFRENPKIINSDSLWQTLKRILS